MKATDSDLLQIFIFFSITDETTHEQVHVLIGYMQCRALAASQRNILEPCATQNTELWAIHITDNRKKMCKIIPRRNFERL